MIMSFLFIHPLGGEHLKEVNAAGRFLKEQTHLTEKISQFTDTRKNPQIKLNHIILSVPLMPFYSFTSLLRLDRLSRKQSFKILFGCTPTMAASVSLVSENVPGGYEASKQRILHE